MPTRWIARPHGPSLERLEAALDGAGAVLIGPDGVGKTLLAHAAAEGFSRQHPATLVRWVSGTASDDIVPFGPFSHLVDIADIGKPAALLRAARESLRNADGDLLLVVDDAHHLDSLSATLVYQLALTGSARVIVTARSETHVPDAITALWTDELLTRIDVEPLDAIQTADLLAALPDQPMDAAEVFRRSRGNPLYLRHLVEGGVEAGVAPPLAALIDRYLDGLPPPVRAVLSYLAVAEPLPLGDLAAMTTATAVEQAEALGVVRTSAHGDDTVVYAAHPLYTERARAALGRDDARARRSSVVTRLSARSGDHVSDQLRLAYLALDSDAPQPVGEVIAAAREALRFGDMVLGERLARSAVDRSDDLAARLPLAYALAWQGRGRDAEAVLAAVDPGRLSDSELMAWALPRAANQFFMLSEPERATAFLQTTRSRISAPAAHTTLDALSATFAMNAGSPRRAIEIAADVLASPSAEDMAVAWAGSAAALCSARMGHLDQVEPMAERALGAEHPGLLRFTIGLGQTTALLMAGRVAAAQQLAQQFTDFAELQQPGRAIGEVLLAQVLIARGDFAAAAALLRPAAATLERTGYSWGPLSLMYLATALGQQGDTAGAAKAHSRAEARHGTKSALFAPELGLARAWRLAAMRDVHGAINAAREAARMAERGGQLAVALRAWHEAVRLGDVHAADQLVRLAADVDCVIGRIAAAHGSALAAGDGVALEAVSDELASAEMYAVAADAAAQAAQAFAIGRQPERERVARARAIELAERCGASTPALDRILGAAPPSP